MLKTEYKDSELNNDSVIQKKFNDLLFIARPDFPRIVSQYNLDFYHHNYLMAAHVLSIGLFSTAINSGNTHMIYREEVVNNGPNIPEAQVYFSFITRTNGNIYDGHCSNSGLRISSPLFSRSFSGARQFRDFIIDYAQSIVKTPTLEEIKALNGQSFKMYYKKFTDPITQINTAHERIIHDHKFVRDLLLFHQIEQKFTHSHGDEADNSLPAMKL
jgi:hypothetical protein